VPNFYVSGSNRFNPYGTLNDAETVLGGNAGGVSASITAISVKLTESYVPLGSFSSTIIPHAWSAGSDSAETVSGVKMSGTSSHIGKAATGADNNYTQLW
jgi:hypothetical protein